MRKSFLSVISILLIISMLSVSITAYAAQTTVTVTDSTSNYVSLFQKIVDFFNNLLNKIRALFGISAETNIEPVVPVVDNTVDVVVNFGAFGDGIHDDTKAIQNALDYLKSTGGTICFPDGVYMISSCLIFYSNQELVFSDNATLKRMDSSEPTKYMLATYTSSNIDAGEYNGVCNSKIVGGTFDGNANIASNLTVINFCHANNVTVSDATFVNGSYWHYIEIASSKNVVVTDCYFDGSSYTLNRTDLTDELIQLDVAKSGNYGPIYNVDGKVINFVKDEVPCVDIEIKNCVFDCAGSPAIGEHNGYAHSNILVHDNIFNGVSGKNTTSNGYVKFMANACSVEVFDNYFNSTANENNANNGIVILNNDTDTNKVYNNTFAGYFSQYYSDSIIVENNTIS